MLFARLTLLSSLFLLAASDGNHSQLRGAIAEPFCPTRKTWETCLGGADQCCSTCRCASTDHCYKKDEYFAQCQPKLHCPTNYPGWSCAIVPPCEDLHVQCGIWAKEGRCNSKSPDADYMISTCQRACQRCMWTETCEQRGVNRRFGGFFTARLGSLWSFSWGSSLGTAAENRHARWCKAAATKINTRKTGVWGRGLGRFLDVVLSVGCTIYNIYIYIAVGDICDEWCISCACTQINIQYI